MRQLPKAKTKDEVDLLFNQLQVIGDENINGMNLFYFLLNYIISS